MDQINTSRTQELRQRETYHFQADDVTAWLFINWLCSFLNDGLLGLTSATVREYDSHLLLNCNQRFPFTVLESFEDFYCFVSIERQLPRCGEVAGGFLRTRLGQTQTQTHARSYMLDSWESLALSSAISWFRELFTVTTHDSLSPIK